MKITLDISKLVEDGKLTPEEAARLQALASHDTGSLAINILIGFGVVSVAAGAVALMMNAETVIVTGLALFAVGCAFILNRITQWNVFAQICLLTGALMFSGGIVGIGEGSLKSMLIVTGALAVGAIVARSSLLAALSVLALSACLGARSGYEHASYTLAIFEPTLTIALFSALACAGYWLSLRLSADYERVALMVSRTSVLLVNFGFWVGSLWGDPLFLLRGYKDHNPIEMMSRIVIPGWVFSVCWALALIAATIWAVKVNRRWLVNIAAAFGTMHFYTQWFEVLGANALTVLLAGMLMLVIALMLWKFNKAIAPEQATADV